jgi:hypothetical protein
MNDNNIIIAVNVGGLIMTRMPENGIYEHWAWKFTLQPSWNINPLSLRNNIFKLCLLVLERMSYILFAPDTRLFSLSLCNKG